MKTRFICLLVEQTGNFPGLLAASDSFVSSLTTTYDEIGHRNSTRRKRANVVLERVISYFLTLKCIISCATATKVRRKSHKADKRYNDNDVDDEKATWNAVLHFVVEQETYIRDVMQQVDIGMVGVCCIYSFISSNQSRIQATQLHCVLFVLLNSNHDILLYSSTLFHKLQNQLRFYHWYNCSHDAFVHGLFQLSFKHYRMHILIRLYGFSNYISVLQQFWCQSLIGHIIIFMIHLIRISRFLSLCR